MKSLSGDIALVATLLALHGCGEAMGAAAGSPLAPTATAEIAGYSSLASAINADQFRSGVTIDTFDDPRGTAGGVPIGWTFDVGGEFPGGRGSLTLQPRSIGAGLHANLMADLDCGATALQIAPLNGCGLYVAMTRRLVSPIMTASPSTAMIAVDVQATDPLLDTFLRVTDTTGQVLQIPYVSRSLESGTGPGRAWVAIEDNALHWDGADDGRLHGGITALSLGIGTGAIASPAASLKVDSIRWIHSGATRLALSRQSTVLSEGVLPSMAGRLAVAAHLPTLSDAALDRAVEAGVSIIRTDLFWSTVESHGSFDFSRYDDVLKQLARHGLSALFILDYGHPDHGGQTPLLPADRAAFAEFARQSALFAKGRNVTGFEIWNEPDNPTFWQQGDPETYAPLLSEARQAIKSVDRGRKVVNGGPGWVDLPYILRLAKTGRLADLDAFAIHPYVPLVPEKFASDIASIRTVLASEGVVKPPVWVTEWGYSSFGPLDPARYGDGHDPRARKRQAVLMLRTALTQLAMNLPLMTLYELSDSGADPLNSEHNFGLLTGNAEPKPAFVGMQALQRAARARTYAGLLKDVPPNVHAMRWDGPDDSVFAVWVDAARVNLRLTLPQGATVTSWTGEAVTTGGAATAIATELALGEEDGPVFVRFPGGMRWDPSR